MLKARRIKDIYSCRHILYDMAVNQLKAKYAGSRLGIWWAVIIPLLLALSINFVFEAISKITIVNYTIFVLSGILPWLFFMGALNEATNSFVVNASILKQSRCPQEFIPVSIILANLLNFFIGFIFLLPLFVIVNLKVLLMLPFLLIIIALEVFFIMGLGLIFSTLNVFFRDLTHFLSVGFTVWFWITPIFYSLEMVSFPYRWICLFNPMTLFVLFYQKILFEAQVPSARFLLTVFVITMISFISGCIVFIKKESELLKRI